MIRMLGFAAVMLLAASLAQARPYGVYDVRRVTMQADKAAGKRPALDLKYLDQMLDDLASHAKNYPPVFESQADKDRAEQDTRTLIGILDIAAREPNPSPEVLLRAAFVNGLGHNLEVAGAGEKANAYYLQLLKAAPDNPRGNYFYGTFLAGTGKFKESIPYLEKSRAAGNAEALYSLGMVQLSLGNKARALDYLDKYRAHAPGDGNIARIIDLIRSGKLEIKQEMR